MDNDLHVEGLVQLTLALDALESMVFQYLWVAEDPKQFGHSFMLAGEEACEVLVRLRPHRWKELPWGVEFIGDLDG